MELRPLPRYGDYVAERAATNWENYVASLRERGRAVDVGPVILDGESVFRRRFTCDTRTCSPTRNPATGRPWRESGSKSCCADLVVDLAPIEVAGLERHWPAIRESLAARDRFFADKTARDCLELSSDYETSIKRRGGRCIFAVRDPEWGIRCGIHAACLERGIPLREAKPVVCDTFPLVVIDLTGGRFFVCAHAPELEGISGLGDYDTDQFPCLARGGRGERLYVAMAEALTAYFGEDAYAAISQAAADYLARSPRPRV